MSQILQRLLIVDDDESVIAGLSALLEGDYDVRSATTGRAAVQKFAETPDLVLLDIQLPDTSGIELLKQFKAYDESVPVVMISGMGTFEMVVEAMKNGAESFLQKPFDFDTLQLTLANLKGIIATRLERDANRRFTGRIEGTPAFREGKVTRVGQWLAESGASWGDFDRVSVYSDSLNDLLLLERATEPVAVNPSPDLEALARERGWRIMKLFE